MHRQKMHKHNVECSFKNKKNKFAEIESAYTMHKHEV